MKKLEVVRKSKTSKVKINKSEDNTIAVMLSRKMAKDLGFKPSDEFLIGTAASELATNIIRYAHSGVIIISIIHNSGKKGIEIEAIDRGPGIANIELALSSGHTTTVRSLGMGLPSVKNIMNDFFIHSEHGKGTHITARKWY